MREEIRELPQYELAFARGDAAPGPQLNRSVRTCDALADADAAGAAGSAREAPPCGVARSDNVTPPRAAIDDDGPSLPTALREQLGLKLKSKTGPVKVLVIDRVSRLIPN